MHEREGWRTGRDTFDRAAQNYHHARPDYPDEMFEDLYDLTGVDAGSQLLEVGCGTGHAPLPLAARGCEITCIERGPALANVARQTLSKHSNAKVVTASFEDWVPDRNAFDLVLAATAWHWLDPQVRYVETASLLRPGGHLAICENTHGFPPGYDTFFAEIQTVYDGIGEPARWWPPPLPHEVPDQRDDIDASGLFSDVVVRRYVWDRSYDVDGYLALLDTFSGHIAMAADKRDHLYGEIRRRLAARPDRSVRRHWLTILHVATRI